MKNSIKQNNNCRIKKNRHPWMILMILWVCILCFSTGCGQKQKDSGKLQIVATLFPQYDFVRQIGGDKVEVTLLLQPGVESHSYDPSPSDLVKMKQSDMIVYMGQYMETWAESLLKTMDQDTKILDLSEGFELKKVEDEHEEEGDEDGDEEEEEGHSHVYDPHLWTNPAYAAKMVETIAAAMTELDPENGEYYQANAEKYAGQIQALDEEIRRTVAESEVHTLYFAGKFAMYYFAEAYGLDYLSAFDSCSSETEPSAKLIAKIVDGIKAEGAKVVYYEELSNHKAADTICQETGAKALLLHSCHNVSKEEMQSGATYLSLMQQNLLNLREGLSKQED